MDERSKDPFPLIKDHILLPFAGALEKADATMMSVVTEKVITDVVELVPDEWLHGETRFESAADNRRAYVEYLVRRLDEPRYFLEEAIRARSVQV